MSKVFWKSPLIQNIFILLLYQPLFLLLSLLFLLLLLLLFSISRTKLKPNLSRSVFTTIGNRIGVFRCRWNLHFKEPNLRQHLKRTNTRGKMNQMESITYQLQARNYQKKENIDTEEAKRINVFLGEQFSQNIKNEERTTRIQKILIVLYAPQQVWNIQKKKKWCR